MSRFGTLYGPDVTFLSVDKCDLDDQSTTKNCDIIVIGAPYDGGTSYRSGTRFGPQALRMTDYIPHDRLRPHLALGVDPLQDLVIKDAGDVCTPPTDIMISLDAVTESIEMITKADAIPIILGGDHSITYADVRGLTAKYGKGRIAVIHFDAHPDTADLELGQLHGHGQWVRRLIDEEITRGDRFIQMGIRGYWPGSDVLKWMSDLGMRSYEMTEIDSRGLDTCIKEAIEAVSKDTDGIFISVDIDVCDPAYAPGTGTPEPGGLTSRQLLNSIRNICMTAPVVGLDLVEMCPAYDHADITALLGNRVILEALSGIAAKRNGSRSPDAPLLQNR
jgi:agmatinase